MQDIIPDLKPPSKFAWILVIITAILLFTSLVLVILYEFFEVYYLW